MFGNLNHFFSHQIWRIELRKTPPVKAFFIKAIRAFLITYSRFRDDKCYLMASALTFYSLLSIVPVLAAAFGIAKGFGFQELLDKRIHQAFSEQQEVFTQATEMAHRLLEETQGGVIAGVGVIFLLWSVGRLLANIEQSLNYIWRVHRSRSIGRQLTDYLALVLICPLIFVTSGSLTVYIATKLQLAQDSHEIFQHLGPVIQVMIQLMPMTLIWVLFSFIYLFAPNTRVRFSSGVFAGILAGSAYQLAQWGYVTFQIGVASYGAIYGSFAALPLFLIWLQVSWLIVLAGAELSAATQSLDDAEFATDCDEMSHGLKRLFSLLIMHRAIKRFFAGKEPYTAQEYAHELELPLRLTRERIQELTDAELLTEIPSAYGQDATIQPTASAMNLTVQEVINTWEECGQGVVPIPTSSEWEELTESLRAFRDIVHHSKANVPLKEIR